MLSRALFVTFCLLLASGTQVCYAQNPEKARQHFEKALKFEAKGHYKSALEQFEKAIAHYPGYFAPYYNRGILHRKMGHFAQAEKDFSQALALYPTNREARINRAMVRHHQEDWEGAISDYSEALAMEADAGVYALRGASLAQADRDRQALYDFDEAIRLDPGPARYYFLRGQCYMKLQDWEEAIENQNRALDRDSTLLEAYYARGEVFFYQEKYEPALADLSHGFPEAHAVRVRGDVNAALGRIDAAREDYNRAIRLDRSEARAYLGRAQLKASSEELPAALSDCDRALEADESLLPAYLLRSDCREKSGDLEGAQADLSVWIDQHPQDSDALFRMGKLSLQLQNPDAAITYLDKSLVQNPNWPEARYLRGLARYTKNDFPAAIEDFDVVVAHDKSNKEVYSYRSRALLEIGKKAEARQDAQMATSLNPEWGHAYLSRALVFFALEMREPACVDLEQALSLNPDPETSDEVKRLLQVYCQ